MKTKAIISVLLIGLIVLFGCTSETPTKGETNEQTDNTTTNNEMNDETNGTTENNVPTKIELTVGETAKTSKIEVIVKSVEKTTEYEYCLSSYCNMETAKEGNTFLIADVEVKNVGADQIYFSVSDFSATDSEGNRYNTEVSLSEDAIEMITQLYQNQKVSGKVYFEVPENSSGLKIIYDFGNIVTGTELASWTVE